jgi:hypothetical protein
MNKDVSPGRPALSMGARDTKEGAQAEVMFVKCDL